MLLARAIGEAEREVAIAEATAALAGFERLGAEADADSAAAFLRSLGVKAARAGPRGIGVLTKRESERCCDCWERVFPTERWPSACSSPVRRWRTTSRACYRSWSCVAAARRRRTRSALSLALTPRDPPRSRGSRSCSRGLGMRLCRVAVHRSHARRRRGDEHAGAGATWRRRGPTRSARPPSRESGPPPSTGRHLPTASRARASPSSSSTAAPTTCAAGSSSSR